MRYAHNVGRVFGIPSQAVALLTVLMLRGPQTAGELRIHSDRLHRFSDISAVEAFLAEMASRAAGALVVELPRLAGARETRWAHLLSGAPPAAIRDTPAPPPSEQVAIGEVAALRATVTQLQTDVAQLRAMLERLTKELGLP
jgi:uncharacterized protein YceH (UPF0502 family)